MKAGALLDSLLHCRKDQSLHFVTGKPDERFQPGMILHYNGCLLIRPAEHQTYLPVSVGVFISRLRLALASTYYGHGEFEPTSFQPDRETIICWKEYEEPLHNILTVAETMTGVEILIEPA